MEKLKKYKPTILIYGIEKVGYKEPREDIETDLSISHFESFDTQENFQDYDGVILFQGIFEEIKEHSGGYLGESYSEIKCNTYELQRRKKQLDLLSEKGGFICFLLTHPFIDNDEFGDKSGSDLAKLALNYPSFYRKVLGHQATSLRPMRNEFIDFLKRFGVAWTFFQNFNNNLALKEICRVGREPAGIILWNNTYFIPTLPPKSHEFEEFFKILTDALISCNKKLSEEIPDWANEFKFEEEKSLIEHRSKLQEEINKINLRLLEFREYKKCICYDDELLRESIIKIFREGFGFKVNDTEEFKEDFKIIDDEGKPKVLLEVKGTNKGITREHINQADSHRERAKMNESFPSVLIVNTNIKKSNSLADKYQEVAKEQIVHAVKMNILVMRTIDLLNMLYLKEQRELSKEQFLQILEQENGWLETSDKAWKIRKE